jgi:hypothetical protein
MQEISNSIKRTILRIMGSEGEEVQAKGVPNIFNIIITENFQILGKFFSFRYRKPPEHQTETSPNRTSPYYY